MILRSLFKEPLPFGNLNIVCFVRLSPLFGSSPTDRYSLNFPAFQLQSLFFVS